MIEWLFILNPDTDNLTIEEPRGFSEIELSLIRDEKFHGIGHEASTNAITFYGAAYTFLKTEKEINGLKSEVIFQAKSRCEGETEYEEIIKARLNFGRYREHCGDLCEIELPLEEDGCQFTFKNRLDHKVDLNNLKSFDGITDLPNYAGIGIEMELPAKELFASVEGDVPDEGDTVTFDTPLTGAEIYYFEVRPTYTEIYNSISTGQLIPSAPFAINPSVGIDELVSPILLFEDTIDCFNGNFTYDIRLKGDVLLEALTSGFWVAQDCKIYVMKATGDYHTSPTVLHEVDLTGLNSAVSDASPVSGSFDEIFTNTTTLADGESIYVLISIGSNIPLTNAHPRWTVNFDTETAIEITATKVCPPSNADVNLVHETLSRVAEAATDLCVRVKSSYYGRTDSEPFFFDEDGCGSLRMLTSGLKIRRAVEDKFFASMKELLEGLNPIDNIGFDLIPDPDRGGKFLLRIEGVDFFYEDREMLSVDSIPSAMPEVEEQRHYSLIKAGYKKWEVENINGLDEIHSTREYRTSLTSVSNTLDIQSSFVAGSYPIEVTRQQSFAASGGADTKYDNDIFIINVERTAYGYQAEQGNILNPENIFSPYTIYNYRNSPIRNLLRWYKSIIPSYPNYSNVSNKLFFGSGTGNLKASGEMESTFCKIEKNSVAYGYGTLSESQNLFITHFEGDDYLPLWRNESVPFEYPLSAKQYKEIKNSPYGYISFQCGQGDYEKGFIKELKFKPAKGTATFILRKKWQ